MNISKGLNSIKYARAEILHQLSQMGYTLLGKGLLKAIYCTCAVLHAAIVKHCLVGVTI